METTTQFFETLLGVKRPWYVAKIVTNTPQGRVDLYIEHLQNIEFPCPDCHEFFGIYDHAPEREFRHLNVFQYKTFLHVRVPRVECPIHGVRQIVHGLADPNGPATYEFERFILHLQQECAIESICRLYDADWHFCQKLQERAVERGLQRKPQAIPQRIGVDEKAFARGHKYETLVYDIAKGTVDAVIDSREQESLEAYYRQFTPEQRKNVQAVAMDMWDPYIAATKAFIPGAENKIVFDKYHVTRMVTKAVDDIRKKESKELFEQGNDILKGTKFLWLWNNENIPEYRRAEFERLRTADLKVNRAYAIKENLRNMWTYTSPGWMRNFFNDWYVWATHSRLTPIIDAAKSLKVHFENIVTYAKHRITNALGESLNSKIEKVNRLACGYRNRAHYKIAILFHCGGLDLYPRRSECALQIISS